VNVDEMQKKLSQKAGKEPEHQFENLYGLLCNENVHYRTLSQHGDISINSLNQTVFIFFPAGH
jgi:hypothetical protein